MKDNRKSSDNTAATEQEIRRGRKFSLAEAVGREAAGALKGASPVPPGRQVLLAAENILETRLVDPEGSLLRTIQARLEENAPLVARHLDNPSGALRELVAGILGSASLLATLVRDADARWGRDYGEKPRFNHPGQAAQPGDPYTPESVAASLQNLLDSMD